MKHAATIDLHTRVEINELMTRFCYFLDHNDGTCWAELFLVDGIFEMEDGPILRGRAELQSLPGLVHAKSQGQWRHVISNVLINHADLNQKTGEAYCMVIDLAKGNLPVNFYEMTFSLRHRKRWHFESVRPRRAEPRPAMVA